MADAPFEAEKDHLVRVPANEATSQRPFVVAPAPAAPSTCVRTADAPQLRKLRVTSRYEIEGEMMDFARRSKTFRDAEAELKDQHVEIEWKVGSLPADKGGGWRRPGQYPNSHDVTLDPETVFRGYHIFDVFLHEYGHVLELSRVKKSGGTEGKGYLEFMNAVQKDLGLCPTPDSHPAK